MKVQLKVVKILLNSREIKVNGLMRSQRNKDQYSRVGYYFLVPSTGYI